MMSGTFVLTDTIDKALLDRSSTTSYAGTNVVVSGKGADITFQGTDARRCPPVDQSLVEEINGPARRRGGLGERRRRDEHEDHRLGRQGDQHGWRAEPRLRHRDGPEVDRFNPLNLVEGNWPKGDGQVVIDVGTADRRGLQGRRHDPASQRSSPSQDFQVTGIVEVRQRRLDRRRRRSPSSTCRRRRSSSTAKARWTRSRSPARRERLPSSSIKEIQHDAARERPGALRFGRGAGGQGRHQRVHELHPVLPARLRGIALFVGAFVIFNTLSITSRSARASSPRCGRSAPPAARFCGR